ncbi:hypothetical protein LCGC14_2089450 [marine sediment metagenome]|uniref:Uncharacterized protein n=1 Tax=marine sediment metagenome TaxID=412755 RepID=A0A0F9F0J2_9ZZZZ
MAKTSQPPDLQHVKVYIPNTPAKWICPKCGYKNHLPVAAAQIGEGCCSNCVVSFWFDCVVR